ncbi:endospore germination permease [Paenibacillus sp. MCAF9]|uniref:GerAB/ArcD/ProY family transporter n=1 Tax=Paenibacillus sp. MCAF9 TaxID=3233046 RepID=UPI003F9A6586
MMKPDTLSVRTFTILVIFFMIGTSILITPAGLTLVAKQDAWLAAIVGIGLNILSVLIYVSLGNRYGDKTLIEMCHLAFGKWIGNVFGLCFIAFFYLLTSLMIGDLGFFLTTQTLPETPIEILLIIFVIIVIFAVRAGMVVYSRAVQIFFPILFFMLSLLIIPIFPQIDFIDFEPILEYGFKPIIKAGFSFSGFQEMIVLLMIYPYVAKSAKRGRGFVWGTVIGGIVLIIITVGCIGVMGASVTANQLFPAYVLAKNINIGHFLERIEGIMMFIWILSIVMKIVLTFDASLIGLCQLFKLKDPKPYVIPMGFGLIALALLCYTNTISINDFLTKNWTPFATIFTIFVPLFILGILLFRGPGESRNKQENTTENEQA